MDQSAPLLGVAAVSKLGDQGKNIVGSIFLYAICGSGATQQSMWGKEPEPCLVWAVELRKLLGQPSQGKNAVEAPALRLNLARAPP